MRFSPAHRRSLAPLLAVCLLGLGGTSAAHAQSESESDGNAEPPAPHAAPEEDTSPPELAEPPARRRVAVLILATGGADPAIADGLSELLVGALAARGGVTIVGKEEFQSQLGQGDDGTIECISSMACLGRVGVQLDVVEVIAGTLALRDERWVFNLNRVDVPRGEIVGRVFREVEGDVGAVADALQAAVPELYAPTPTPEPQLPPAPSEPAPGVVILSTSVDGADVTVDGALIGQSRDGELRYELPAGSVEVRVTAPGFYAWQRTVRVISARDVRIEVGLEEAYEETVHPWVWVGAGVAVAAFATGLTLGVLSQDTLVFTDEQRMSGDVLRRDVVAFYDARRNEAIAADVLFVFAGAAAASAVLALFFPDRRRVAGVAVLPTLQGVLVRGAF